MRNREKERERERERKSEPWHNFYGTGSPRGVHLSQRSTRSTKEQRNMKSNQQRERA